MKIPIYGLMTLWMKLKSWELKGLKRLEPPIEGTRTVYYKVSDVIRFLEN